MSHQEAEILRQLIKLNVSTRAIRIRVEDDRFRNRLRGGVIEKKQDKGNQDKSFEHETRLCEIFHGFEIRKDRQIITGEAVVGLI